MAEFSRSRSAGPISRSWRLCEPGRASRSVGADFSFDHLASLTRQTGSWPVWACSRAVDFRGQAESAALSYELPHVRYQALPIEPTVVQRAGKGNGPWLAIP